MLGDQALGSEVTDLRGGVMELSRRLCAGQARSDSDFEMIDALQRAANSLGVVERLLTTVPVSASVRLARLTDPRDADVHSPPNA